LSESESDDDSFSATAGFSLGKQEVQNGFNIGDAQYLIPPFTGNGMSMALESSALAVDSLLPYSKGEISWETAQESYRLRLKKQFGKRTALAASMHPFIFNSIGRSSLKILGKNDLLPINSLFTQLRTP